VARTEAHVTPAVLRWARVSIGYDLEQASKKIGTTVGRLAQAEAGEAYLTLRQAEKAADAFQQPLALLFSPEPPTEAPQEAQLRQLPDAPPPPWPPDMVLMARRVRERQEAAKELRDLLEDEPTWPKNAKRLAGAGNDTLPALARTLLGIPIEEQMSWRDTVGYNALRHWTDALEALGILVMQTGEVDIQLMRGFAAVDETVPAIVVNSADDPRARAYTALHEFGHLALSLRDSVGDPERWCEEFAGNALMPPDTLRTQFRSSSGPLLKRIDSVARDFSVTPAAATVRLLKISQISQREANEALEEIRRRRRPEEERGGNYYSTQIGRMGPAFIRLVFTALENQALTYPGASSLLGVKVNNFEKLRTYLAQREGAPV
jgi:Zn-dependent peptidase ImmA (M78 family)